MKKIIVIGGGASGLIASGFAAQNNDSVILIEKNSILGKKLLITGKGRCNVSNDSDIENHLLNCVTNRKFLYNIFYQYFVHDIVEFFESRNVKLKIERGNRIFPQSDNAADIVQVLEDFIRKNRVEVLKEQVISIEKFQNKFFVKTLNGTIECDKVIFTTGGKSYPGTGSTGDGYKFAKKFGHNIITPRSALIPFDIKEEFPKLLQGLTLKNIRVKINDLDGKAIFEDFGELLFTHFGVSGPLIISAGSIVKNVKSKLLIIDLKPALSIEVLENRLIKDLLNNSKKSIKKLLKLYLPNKMIPIILNLAKLDENKRCNSISKNERTSLIYIMKNLTLTIQDKRPLREGIITSGGIDVKEINPQTMESKIVRGLYFAGEIIDVDSLTGGYNLQIAWSTGFVAGNSC